MDPLKRDTERNGQVVLPGAEATTRQGLQARAETRLRGTVPQKGLGGADTPLLDVSARLQQSLF